MSHVFHPTRDVAYEHMFETASPSPSRARLVALASTDDMSSVLDRIERRLHEVEGQLARTTRDAVFEHLTRNPGSRADEIAAALKIGQGAVSAHLQRGKGHRFVCGEGRWYPVPNADVAAAGR